MAQKVLSVLCPVLRHRVVCDGHCFVVSSAVVGSRAVHICAIREKALDRALNCR